MVARAHTVAFQGIDVLPIEVQVQMANGLPAFIVVGLPDKAVGESRERVRAALNALGLALPPKRIVVNLAPADVLKEGSHFDLPIAVALLAAMGVLPADEVEAFICLGELALDGSLMPVNGVLPAAMGAVAAEKGLICPAPCGGEAAWAGSIEILAPATLLALINHFKGTQVLGAPVAKLAQAAARTTDLGDIKGQETAKRVLEVAAAGGHNLLFVGPPGSGKSMLAARLPALLPQLTPIEALEVSMIHSVAGLLTEGRLIHARPFRDPHHSASLPALVGGGARARPGEISLAHRGVLFLDELPEFHRATLEALRQPLETGRAVVARANAHVVYPARVQLVAAMNPCRCGYLDDPSRACSRVPHCARDYQAKISGPLLDRIDLRIDVPAVTVSDLTSAPAGEPTDIVAQRVAVARDIQKDRFAALKASILTNAEAESGLLTAIAEPDSPGRQLMIDAADRLQLSARGYHRILKVARTLADLEGADGVRRLHIAEALSYRRFTMAVPRSAATGQTQVSAAPSDNAIGSVYPQDRRNWEH